MASSPISGAVDGAIMNAQAKTEIGYDLVWGLKIPLRDGLKLHGTLYRPKGATEQLPVIVFMTPYTADVAHARGAYFAQHGYNFVVVDVRGRGNSEGEFMPFLNEAYDGYDTVEWLAKQPWSNGKVGMWGASYSGFAQWMTLREEPPHLQTIAPAASVGLGVDWPARRNITYSYIIQWLTFTSGHTYNAYTFDDPKFWISRFQERYTNHRPFKDLDAIAGNMTTSFRRWLFEHPTPAHWDYLAPTPEDYSRITVPILTITGHYDADQFGALHYYRQHMRHGNPAWSDQHYLVIGPWDHAGARSGFTSRDVKGLTFGEASVVDLNSLHRDWYDWTLKDGERPKFLQKRVTYYTTGIEEWRYGDELDNLSIKEQKLYVSSPNGSAHDVFSSGALDSSEPSPTSIPDRYVYDPRDIRPGCTIEAEPNKTSLVDERFALNLFGTGLIYHTEPFETDIEITGHIKLIAHLQIDVPDADFIVKLYEITSAGMSIELTSDLLRARYRHSLKQPTLVTPGQVDRYEFSGFPFFSRKISKGSRLRLIFASLNSIYWEKNYQGGGTISEESGDDARVATVILYHDSTYPTYLQLPMQSLPG